MNLSTKEINALGQITQHGWGVSSMPNAVTCSSTGDTITMKFMTVIHFAANDSLRAQVERITNESIDVLTKCVADTKKQFKELTGRSLSLKEVSNRDSIEVIAATNLSPRRVAYYRRQVVLSVM
jgi:hypothetical protein